MARIRTIKPEFWADEKLAPLPALARLVFLGLISMADDAGRVLDSVRAIDGFIFPLAEEDSCAESLCTLAELGCIRRGQTASGQKVIQIAGWEKHQRIDKPNLSSALPAIVALSSPTNPAACKPQSECELGSFVEASPNDPGSVADESTPRSTIYDLRSTINDRGSDALTREAPTPESIDAIVDDEPLPDVPGDFGGKVVPLRPAVPLKVMPFAGQDWAGRVSGSQVLREWIKLQPVPPSQSDRDRFGRSCRTIADEHSCGEIALAILGMGNLWPHAPPKSEPWDPDDLRKKFAKAIKAAETLPELVQMREDAAFERAFDEATTGTGR